MHSAKGHKQENVLFLKETVLHGRLGSRSPSVLRLPGTLSLLRLFPSGIQETGCFIRPHAQFDLFVFN